MEEGCRIYVDSYDPSGECLFFRWDYTETWEYRIPYAVTNKSLLCQLNGQMRS